MNEILVIHDNENPNFPINGRELHEQLGIQTAYKDWFPRMCEYGFTEGVDFNPLKNEQVRTEGNRQVKREIADHMLTLSMAKEICMIQRSSLCRVQAHRMEHHILTSDRPHRAVFFLTRAHCLAYTGASGRSDCVSDVPQGLVSSIRSSRNRYSFSLAELISWG